MFKLALITCFFIAVSQCASARPVSYAGGWTLIEETNRQSTRGLIHYTPNRFYSLGLRADWDRQDDIFFVGPQATWLAKRWFGEDHQANLYFWGAAGLADEDGSDGSSFGSQIGTIADWETRRLFLSYRASARYYEGIDKTFSQSLRLGVAPYLGDSGDLHTWLMVELDNRPDNPEPLGITPLIRLFYNSALFEAGWSLTDNQPLINFQYRF